VLPDLHPLCPVLQELPRVISLADERSVDGFRLTRCMERESWSDLAVGPRIYTPREAGIYPVCVRHFPSVRHVWDLRRAESVRERGVDGMN